MIMAVVALTATFAPSAASAAAPTPTPSFCQSYPVGAVPAATLTVSTTVPFAGETITVGGTNFVAHESLTIELNSAPIVLAHVTTSASGSFSTPVTLPSGVTGTHTISVAGDTSSCPSSPITITINSAGTSSASGGLPNTGVDILTGLAVALALLVAGIALTGGARRRSGRHSAG
jgi:hypothetical protein